MNEQHDMYFGNPVFHDGINLTTRVGDKWTKLRQGDQLTCWGDKGAEGPLNAEGTVIGFLFCPLCMIPSSWLKNFEHDPACRTHEGLLADLTERYPASRIGPTTMVTAILFQFEKLARDRQAKEYFKSSGSNSAEPIAGVTMPLPSCQMCGYPLEDGVCKNCEVASVMKQQL